MGVLPVLPSMIWPSVRMKDEARELKGTRSMFTKGQVLSTFKSAFADINFPMYNGSKDKEFCWSH